MIIPNNKTNGQTILPVKLKKGEKTHSCNASLQGQTNNSSSKNENDNKLERNG